MVWFPGVVVITSALHAEGLGFEPRGNLTFYLKFLFIFLSFFVWHSTVYYCTDVLLTLIFKLPKHRYFFETPNFVIYPFLFLTDIQY